MAPRFCLDYAMEKTIKFPTYTRLNCKTLKFQINANRRTATSHRDLTQFSMSVEIVLCPDYFRPALASGDLLNSAIDGQTGGDPSLLPFFR